MDTFEGSMKKTRQGIPLLQRMLIHQQIVLDSQDRGEIESALDVMDQINDQMPEGRKSRYSREFLLENMGDLAPARQKCLDMGIIFLS